MSADPAEDPEFDRLERAKKAGVPTIYANGFENALGTGDVVMVLERNGEPAAIVNLSFTLAKSLSVSLARLISALEAKTGREIMSTRDVEDALESRDEQGADQKRH